MAIVCPRCGRQYDVTLFEFGISVTCDCGERVNPFADDQTRPGASGERKKVRESGKNKPA